MTQSVVIAWLNLTKQTVMVTQYEYNPVSGGWIAPEPKYYKLKYWNISTKIWNVWA